jgi:3-oxoacyl-[acyl-carrier-protein] synthase II
MPEPRIVITGLGLVSPLAQDAEEHFRLLLSGASALEPMTDIEYRNFPHCLQAKVHDIDRRKLIAHRMLRKLLSRSAVYAVVAAGQALKDGGVQEDFECLRECGLYVGSVLVDIDPELFLSALKGSLDQTGKLDITQFATRGMFLIDPLFLVRALPNAGLCGIAVEHQTLGPNLNLTNGAISGVQAIISAANAIRRGETEIALAGGYDSLLRMDSFIEHFLGNRLSKSMEQPQRACRPFDMERDGYALGEGAAFVLVESEQHALARNAHIYGELVSSGQATDATCFIEQTPKIGVALEYAARQALEAARCDVSEIDVLFGDGLATVEDDLSEAAAAQRLFGETPVPFTAATGSTGYLGTAGGPFSLIHALMGMQQSVVPPMINCTSPDPRCALPFVHEPEHRPYKRALVWNSDRGVKNAALLISSYAA